MGLRATKPINHDNPPDLPKKSSRNIFSKAKILSKTFPDRHPIVTSSAYGVRASAGSNGRLAGEIGEYINKKS
jgi:hypothetical protein